MIELVKSPIDNSLVSLSSEVYVTLRQRCTSLNLVRTSRSCVDEYAETRRCGPTGRVVEIETQDSFRGKWLRTWN